MAAILYLYPLNFFYYFLYYTDTLSTTSVVLTYWLALSQQRGGSGGGGSGRGTEGGISSSYISRILLFLVRKLFAFMQSIFFLICTLHYYSTNVL